MASKPKVQSKKHIARLERERRQVRLITYISIGVIVAVVLILVYGYLDMTYLQDRRPVAEVNGEKITAKEFKARVTMQRNQLLNQYMQYSQYSQMFGMDFSSQLSQIKSTLDTPTVLGQQVVDALIQEALIRQEAAKRGITVTADELETFKREQFGYYPNGTPTPTTTPTPVDVTYPTLSPEQLKLVTPTPVVTATSTALPPTATPTATQDLSATPAPTATITPTLVPSPTATPYTLAGYQEQINKAIQSVKDIGLTEAQYSQLFETEYLRKKLYDEVTKDTPKEEEQVWARHILVANQDLAKQLVERLKNGEDFGTLAMEFSTDTGSAVKGGDLGWFGKGSMIPEFEQAAFSLKIGEISDPIKSQYGWHIIQVLGKTTVPMTASQYDQARQTAFNDFLTGLRDNANVVTYDAFWLQIEPTTPNSQDLQAAQ